MYPVYVHGEAHLAAYRGSEAAAEFQKILGPGGVVLNETIGALVHLGLARAHADPDFSMRCSSLLVAEVF